MGSATDSSETYVFNRDYRSSIRLNLNHWITKGLTGYLLHPKIKYPEDAVIADIGAGTAIWLQELAEKVKDPAQLHGFDNSPEQYPAAQFRPPNVTLTAHDCFTPFPQEYIGKFDVVHIRFFRCIVKKNDPEPLLQNLIKLLKPGGYLQWYDVLGAEAHVETTNKSATTTASEQLARLSILPKPDLPADWVAKLPEFFAKTALEVVVSETVPYRNAYRLPWGQSMLLGIEDMSAQGNDEQARQKAKGWIGMLGDEMAQGVMMEHPSICVVGQKKAP